VHRLKAIWKLGVKVEVKLRLFDAMVMSVLLYGSGSWAHHFELTKRHIILNLQKEAEAARTL